MTEEVTLSPEGSERAGKAARHTERAKRRPLSVVLTCDQCGRRIGYGDGDLERIELSCVNCQNRLVRASRRGVSKGSPPPVNAESTGYSVEKTPKTGEPE